MKVKHINAPIETAMAVPARMDEAGIAFERIDSVNWMDYPYCPEVSFRIAYTDDALLLHYRVKEKSTRAKYATDNEAVWTDSCVEAFFMPCDDGVYYNLECNSIATILLAAGNNRNQREFASESVLSKVSRWSTFEHEPFEEQKDKGEWEVALLIPLSSFFNHQIESLKGKQMKANFYKCGDELQTPHFLSWKPIETETPDFHCPDFFDALSFE